MKKLVEMLLVSLWVFSFCSFAESAEIQLVSGERLQGDLLSVGDGRMVLDCSWGEANIELEAIEEIYFVPREQKVSDKGLLLVDGTNLLAAQLTEKRGEKFVFDLPYGKLIITDPEQLLYLNIGSPGELLVPQGLEGMYCYVLLQSRGGFARERIMGELLQYLEGALKVRTLQGILEIPQTAVSGISFAGGTPPLEEKSYLRIWDNIPIQGKPISFIENTWTIEAPFGVFIVERPGLIQEIAYPSNELSLPEKQSVFVSLGSGTDLWGNIIAWKDNNVELSTRYGTLNIPASTIYKVSSTASLASNYLAVPSAESKRIDFSGYTWLVKIGGQITDSTKPIFFSWSKDNVWVDSQGQLHLKITRDSRRWYCAEIVSEKSFGYGKYLFYLAGRTDELNENVVLGFFTWETSPENNNREIDIEFARWGNVKERNTQFVVQPWDLPENIHRFDMRIGNSNSTHSFEWRKDSIFFQSVLGHYANPPDDSHIIESWNYVGTNIPEPGNEKARIVLWLAGGNPPSDNKEVEIIIKKFEFIPSEG